MTPSLSSPHIAIIGAGIIGLSCAWELAKRGAQVTIYDKNEPGRGASWAAAGMLAPAYEAAAEEGAHPRLFDLCMESAALWPGFADAIGRASGRNLGFSAGPSLALAFDASEAAGLQNLRDALERHNVESDMLGADAIRQIEPAVSPDVEAALNLPTDGQIDNRAIVTALIAALSDHASVRFVVGQAPLEDRGGRLHLPGHDIILAAAGWSTASIKVEQNGQLYSLVNWDTALDEIDCYGGQMLSVARGPGLPSMTVRCGGIYIAPKPDRIIIGATMEQGVATDHADADTIAGLRADAARLCPAIAGATQLETWAGVRPGTADHAPLIGRTQAKDLFVASGHYRNGILLAPVTAQIMADMVLEGKTSALAAAFSPARFAAATA
ncbi:glycine oxidase ThiO [Hyphomonas johnsonii]|uniref:Putative glycine oxidase n=1 Tax=Hyphomonas johnsonii MHS-2 TaxID=1280950 RepID=A0A059FAI7_9PROT|nr:glycine oxidase ThiO [Hyphomonas johnsonii]KCZ87617.1 putative glycine oxidase [Hyphomonas johnsonii MHS-2]